MSESSYNTTSEDSASQIYYGPNIDRADPCGSRGISLSNGSSSEVSTKIVDRNKSANRIMIEALCKANDKQNSSINSLQRSLIKTVEQQQNTILNLQGSEADMKQRYDDEVVKNNELR